MGGLPIYRQEPVRGDKSRKEVTRGDKRVLNVFTDIYNVKYYILHLLHMFEFLTPTPVSLGC